MQIHFPTRQAARKASFGKLVDNGATAEQGKRFGREIQHDEQFPFMSGMLAISPLGGFVPVEWKNRKRHTITA